VGRPVQQRVGPQMALDKERGAVQLVVSLMMIPKTLKGLWGFDM